MRKVEKDLTIIPRSLEVDSESILRNPAKTTNDRRLEVISLGSYPDSSKYDARYKSTDIKDQLNSKYLGKCAYCESPVEQLVVEHYRPKRGGYYWLAYSWDNLLLACPKCNEYKGDSFPVSRTAVTYDPSRDTINRIHVLGACYDRLERPLIVNPEKVSSYELNSITFDKDGQIRSKNIRMHRTIDICKLYRKQLCERRRKIWDDLRKEILLAVILAGNDKDNLSVRLNQTIESFSLKCKDRAQDYTAFRQFVLKKSSWIADYLKEIIGE